MAIRFKTNDAILFLHASGNSPYKKFCQIFLQTLSTLEEKVDVWTTILLKMATSR